MRALRTRGAIAAVMLGTLAVVGTGGTGSAGAVTASTSSVTVAGHGAFSDLRVTVNQTTNLVDQVVSVTWQGATPTVPDSASFSLNYLQIMQCWGTASGGPDRTQCEFGGNAAFDTRGGDYAATRQVNYGSLVDPDETLKQAPGSTDTVYVPFTSVTGKSVTGNANEFFDSSTTNEIQYARTRPDGSGQQFFEVQTRDEAPGLGCGDLVAGKPRSCWLVVVPRDNHEVDGTTRAGGPNSQLVSSPLSTSNWANRLVVPLGFAPVHGVCPIGASERPTVGVETVGEAMARWQPVLCAGGGPVYGYTQTLDGNADRQATSDQPGMVFLTRPVPKDVAQPGQSFVYAPVALSGLTIAFNIDSQSPTDAPDAIRRREGRRITDLQLTPRLVAKLLTQSYRLGVDADAGYLKNNPEDLTRDPDFLALNPEFKDLKFRGIGDIIVQAGVSDATKLVWEWIASDDDAMNFIAGTPDPWGMKVNPFYQGMDLPQETFPKADPFCHTYTTGPAPLCTLDAHPYSSDFHDAARAAGRGDTLARSAWDPFANPPAYKKAAPQLSGQRALLALTDTATAARYGLVPAKLRNASGQYVAPDSDTILAGLAAMTPDSDDSAVLSPNPGGEDPLAYPLTTLAYAVTNPSALPAHQAADYANLIRFAVGKGQVLGDSPGQLPEGYVPLPAAQRAQARLVAREVQLRESGTPSSGDSSGNGQEGGTGASGGGATGSTPAGVPTAGSTPQPTATPTTTPVASTPVALTHPTPADQMSLARLAVVGIAGAGLAAALAGPALPWIGRWRESRRRKAAANGAA